MNQISRNHVIKMKVRLMPCGTLALKEGSFEDLNTSLT